MKIYVYAICKNEEKFVKRWMDAVSEADGVFVLDTGSSDGSVEALKRLGATVESKAVEPWRFDTARNLALSLVPDDADLCVSLDLDEVILPGWRKKMEECAEKNESANLFACYYVWSQTADGSDGVSFFIKKTHRRRGFWWKGVVHEVVTPLPGTPLVEATADGVKIVHKPDDKKSRSQYLPLLERAVTEEPQNDRNAFYLGREYFFYGRYADCVRALNRHLSLPTAKWDEERSASRRYLAAAHERLGDDNSAHKNYLLAVGEYPFCRESWLALAKYYYKKHDSAGVIFAVKQALNILSRSASYLNEPESFSALPFDLLSMAYYESGDFKNALAAAENALALAPNDERIRKNADFFRKNV